MKPKLSVVFVNYNSAGYLKSALESLASVCRDVAVEVIVADNGSRRLDEVKVVCGRFGARLLALGRNLGYGAAANRGARFAQGEYLAVANPDLVFQPGSIPALVRFLDDERTAGVVGPQLRYPDGTFHPSARRFPRLRYVLAGRRSVLRLAWPGYSRGREFLYLGAEQQADPVGVESVVGPFMVFRHRAFDEAGGFDERFFMFAEDIDICRRLGRSWGVFLLPGARVVHAVGGSRRRVRRFTEYHRMRSHRLFLRDNAGAFHRLLLEFLFVAYAGLFFAGSMLGVYEQEHSWTAGSGV